MWINSNLITTASDTIIELKWDGTHSNLAQDASHPCWWLHSFVFLTKKNGLILSGWEHGSFNKLIAIWHNGCLSLIFITRVMNLSPRYVSVYLTVTHTLSRSTVLGKEWSLSQPLVRVWCFKTMAKLLSRGGEKKERSTEIYNGFLTNFDLFQISVTCYSLARGRFCGREWWGQDVCCFVSSNVTSGSG